MVIIMYNLAGVFITVLCYFGYICAAEKFCKEYLEISKIREKLFVIFGFCGGMLINVIFQRDSMPNILLTLLEHILFIGLVLLLCRGDIGKKILAVSVLITIRTLVENFCMSFISCLMLFCLHRVKGVPVPVLGNERTNLLLSICLVMTILVTYWGSKHFTSVFYLKSKEWYIIAAVPLFVITEVIDVANWGASNGILVRSGGNMSLYYDQIFSYMEFGVLTLLSTFGTVFFIFGMNKIYFEQKKSSQYHCQITAYKMLEEQYSQSERLRHDLKNHILALSGLLGNKEWEKMESYLKKMEDSAGVGIGEEITGNRVVDVLLYQKRKMAERENIIWECDVQIPKICCINEFDLCVLFGNILDNAVESCERLQHNGNGRDMQMFISVQAKVVKKCFLLEVKNSVDMAEEQKDGFINEKNIKENIKENAKENTNGNTKDNVKESAKGHTKEHMKEHMKEHGIGLLNVKDVVHRYNGIMNIETSNGVFTISILIPLNDAAYNIKQAV